MPQKDSKHTKALKSKNQLSKADIFTLLKDGWKGLFAPTDISTIVVFRIMFGFILLVEIYRYFDHGWISRYWIDPDHLFSFWPFDFLSPLPGNGMYILFIFMGFLSLFIMLGLFYRLSIIAFFLCFSYIFLLDQTRYLNHFYLIVLISFVMIFISAGKSYALDAKWFPKKRQETCAVWEIWLLRFMIAVPYFFGGIAKINMDWLQGYPLKLWLTNDMDFPIIGQFFDQHWMILILSYSGLFLDLLIAPLLLFRKTRILGLIMITTFHLMNTQLFEIGIFPWFMIAACVLFFDPSWFRKKINIIRTKKEKWRIGNYNNLSENTSRTLSLKQKTILASLLFWFSLQSLMPLRHLVIPGNVSWTEEGHRFAWHMKLRTKRGRGDYAVVDKQTREKFDVDIRKYVTSRQKKKMGGKPVLIWQLCQIIKDDYASKGKDVEVYADVQATLNGRVYQQLIDPTVDLASVPRPVFKPAKWIIPLTTKLENQRSK